MSCQSTPKNESKKTVSTDANQDSPSRTCALSLSPSLSPSLSRESAISATLSPDTDAMAKAMHRASLKAKAGQISWKVFDLIARLLYLDMPTQQEIAQSLEVSISTVKRWIGEAEREGLIVKAFVGGRVFPLVQAEEYANANTAPPVPLPPVQIETEYTEEIEPDKDWKEKLDATAPHWSRTKLKTSAKRRLERVFELNSPNDLSEDRWNQISQANHPLLLIGSNAFTDKYGSFVGDVRPTKKTPQFSKQHRSQPITKPQAQPLQEPESSVDPESRPSTEEERAAFFAKMSVRSNKKGKRNVPAPTVQTRQVIQGTDELSRRRDSGSWMRPTL